MTIRARPGSAIARRISRRSLLRAGGLGLAGLAGAALLGCAAEEAGVTVTASTPTPLLTPSPTVEATPTPVARRLDGTLRVHLAAAPASLDPYVAATVEARTVAGLFYSRLYRADSTPDRGPWATGVTPDLAEGAETADGRTWNVRIRPGVRFQDAAGTMDREVTADDVVASFSRLTAFDSPAALSVSHWTRAVATDERTVRFTLAAPNAGFLDELADIGRLLVAPREAVDGDLDLRGTAAGSGPWMLEHYDPGEGLRVRANPARVGVERPSIEALEIAFLDDPAALRRFREGALDLTSVRADEVLPLRAEQHDVQWRGALPPLMSFLYFSAAVPGVDVPWADERFRQAVSLLQDRDALTQEAYNLRALRDAGLEAPVRWNNLVPAGFERWWLDPAADAHGDSARFFRHDPAEARRLLDAAGYAGEAIPFVLPDAVYGTAFDAVADGIVASLSEAGIALQVERQDFASRYLTDTFRGQFTGIAFGHQSAFAEVGDYFQRMFGRDETNHGRVRDPAIDDLVDRQAVALDESERRDLVHEIQRLNAERMYYVPSQAGAGYLWTAYRPDLRGIVQTRGAGAGAEVYPALSFAE